MSRVLSSCSWPAWLLPASPGWAHCWQCFAAWITARSALPRRSSVELSVICVCGWLEPLWMGVRKAGRAIPLCAWKGMFWGQVWAMFALRGCCGISFPDSPLCACPSWHSHGTGAARTGAQPLPSSSQRFWGVLTDVAVLMCPKMAISAFSCPSVKARGWKPALFSGLSLITAL